MGTQLRGWGEQLVKEIGKVRKAGGKPWVSRPGEGRISERFMMHPGYVCGAVGMDRRQEPTQPFKTFGLLEGCMRTRPRERGWSCT